MSKTIAFIDNFDEVDIFLKTFKSYIDKEIIYIAGDALAYKALNDKGIQSRTLDDYRNQKEYEEADCLAVEFAGSWFFDYEGNDFTEFEGISLGKCLKKEIFYHFNYLFKGILDVSNILKYESPGKVLLLNNISTSNGLEFINRDLNFHKKVFLFLMKEKKYDVDSRDALTYESFYKCNNIFGQFRFERQNILKGKIFYYCPAILNRFMKKLIVVVVDQVKMLASKNENKFSSVRALTLSASDLTFFGEALIKSYLKKSDGFIYYLEDENNCYFNSRILSVLKKKKLSSAKNKQLLKYISDLKFKFEIAKQIEKKNPRLVFMKFSIIHFAEKYLNEIIEGTMPRLIRLQWLSHDAIKRNNINMVLISERWGAKRVILTQIAKRNGLSVLHIPHSIEPGIIDGNKIKAPHATDIKHFPFYPTHEISGLRYQQKLQIRRGISKDKLFLTGIPRFGNVKPKSLKMYYDARKRLGFLLDEEIVLFAIRAIYKPFYDKYIISGQISTFTLSYLYNSFLKIFLKRKNSRAVFKLKMLDLSTEWLVSNIRPRDGINNILIFKNNLNDLLIASDAVVVTHSNIGIEALYNDTPVIVYNNPNKPSLLPLCAEKAAIEIKSPEKLVPVLDRLRNEKNYREERLKIQRDFLQKNLPNDGLSSSERVSDVIIQLARKVIP